MNVLIDDPNIVANAAVDWSRLSLDKNSVLVPILCYDDNQLRAKASTTKRFSLDAPSFLSSPSCAVIHPFFPLQPAFTMTVDKTQGQTTEIHCRFIKS